MGKTALIDCDILRYECGAVGQDKDGNIRPFDFVKQVFDERVRTILIGAGCSDAELFITLDKRSYRIYKRNGGTEEFSPNFREALAVGKPYKGTRTKDKPFHWINLTAYILSLPNTRVAIGYEADDLIGIEHTARPTDTIICTRDKDLRQIPGWQYGWECGPQPEFGPVEYDDLGKIELVRSKSSTKIVGGGWAFFCAQLLTGDVVDNIGGSRGIGPVKAIDYLRDCTDKRSYFNSVIMAYQASHGAQWKECLAEQCALLWIVRERLPDGRLKHFNLEEWIDGTVSSVQAEDLHITEGRESLGEENQTAEPRIGSEDEDRNELSE